MKWPLHYQILAAMLGAAVVGLLANSGPVGLEAAHYVSRTSEDGQSWVLELPGSADESLPAEVDPGVLLREAAVDNLTPKAVAGGEVRDRRVRLRDDSDKIVILYSRVYWVGDRSVPMVTRLTVAGEEELQETYPWLVAPYKEHRSSLGCLLDVLGQTLGGLFLRLLKMVTVPLIATSLVVAVSKLGSGGRLGGMFARTLLYYLATSLLAISTGLALVNVIRPGVGAELPGAAGEHVGGGDASLPDVFLGLVHKMIPTNPVAALAEGDFLSIITFSILFGLFLQKLDGPVGETLGKVFEGAFATMMGLTQFVIRLAPIGVAAFMLSATVSQGVDVFGTLGWYLLTVFLALLVHAILVLPLIVRYVGRRNPWEYCRAMSPALLTAFSTASSNGTLPLTMSCVEERAKVPARVGSFVLPLGATINMDGTALYEVVAVLFIAQATPGFTLGMEQQVLVAVTALLASVGAAGIPHAGLVMMAIVLQAVGLPLEAQGLILAVDRVLDMCRTSVNVWSDACGCAVVARFTPTEPGEASLNPLDT